MRSMECRLCRGPRTQTDDNVWERSDVILGRIRWLTLQSEQEVARCGSFAKLPTACRYRDHVQNATVSPS